MDNNRPKYNDLFAELKSQLPKSVPKKGTKLEIHLNGDYSSKIKKVALHNLGYTPTTKKIGKDFKIIPL